jgi:hypothetical protein
MPRVRNVGHDEGRLEQSRVVPAHDLRGGDGGQVCRPLVLAPGAERLAQAEQDQRARQQSCEYAE